MIVRGACPLFALPKGDLHGGTSQPWHPSIGTSTAGPASCGTHPHRSGNRLHVAAGFEFGDFVFVLQRQSNIIQPLQQ